MQDWRQLVVSAKYKGDLHGASLETNWAGNQRFHWESVHFPRSVEETARIVKKSSQVKVVGSRHSFNDIADTDKDHISLMYLTSVTLDKEACTVKVEGGVRYSDLCRFLNGHGYALRNLASLPHISVAGACATGTHGSGETNPCLAAQANEIEIIDANGDLRALTRVKDTNFNGAVVALGALGVVTSVTLDVTPAFEMYQLVYQNLALSTALEEFDSIQASGYSVSLFTDWSSPIIKQIWQKGIAGLSSGHMYGAKIATQELHPISHLPPDSCTQQLGIAGPWHERLPHFRDGWVPSCGDELQSEYLVPRKYVAEALLAVSTLGRRISRSLLISEIRTVAADDLWLSPAFQRDSVAIHFTWRNNRAAVDEILPDLEAVLRPFDARPHWGKIFSMSRAQLEPLYEKLPDFRKLLETFDPERKFGNKFLADYIY